MSLPARDRKTEAPKLFDYVEEPHSASARAVEFFFPIPNADHAEMGFRHGGPAAVVWDPAAAELIRCAPQIVAMLRLYRQELILAQTRSGKPAAYSDYAFAQAETQAARSEQIRDLLARLTRGAAEDGGSGS